MLSKAISLLLLAAVAAAQTECTGYTCSLDSTCIPIDWVCDGYVDCPGGDDDLGCSECNEGFHCNDDTCVPEKFVCDGLEDCEQGEDEIAMCPCQPDDYICENGHCISPSWLCDGEIDCFGGDDEFPENCPVGRSNTNVPKQPRKQTRGKGKLLRKLQGIRHM